MQNKTKVDIRMSSNPTQLELQHIYFRAKIIVESYSLLWQRPSSSALIIGAVWVAFFFVKVLSFWSYSYSVHTFWCSKAVEVTEELVVVMKEFFSARSYLQKDINRDAERKGFEILLTLFRLFLFRVWRSQTSWYSTNVNRHYWEHHGIWLVNSNLDLKTI